MDHDRILRRLLDLVYPQACRVCDQRVSQGPPLCAACRNRLPANERGCPLCAQPDTGSGPICGACQRHPPAFDGVYAPWHYTAPIDEWIRQFKYSDQISLARLLTDLTGADLAPKLGVRESRRLVGEHVVSANDLIEGVKPEDTIFVSHRKFDIWTEGKKNIEAYPDVKHHGIPYRSLLPRELNGLIVVGKAISGTHIAMSAYRTQGILAFVGEAGGVAASLCAKRQTSPRNLAPAELINTLSEPPHSVEIDAYKD